MAVVPNHAATSPNRTHIFLFWDFRAFIRHWATIEAQQGASIVTKGTMLRRDSSICINYQLCCCMTPKHKTITHMPVCVGPSMSHHTACQPHPPCCASCEGCPCRHPNFLQDTNTLLQCRHVPCDAGGCRRGDSGGGSQRACSMAMLRCTG